ncbi:hypothetical protein [Sporosarcina sp. YIM B06819]|uniref:hypothetical protein n=1 Tax=Sporosarcina sp. YIM B06819 TaxID=3081769 RepID=UPI00298D02B4|nr:hypothetical protein [Sporosarcina sp. YIM B06819]
MIAKLQKQIHKWILSNFQGYDFSSLSLNIVTNWFNPNPLSKHEIQQLQIAKIKANAKLHNFI